MKISFIIMFIVFIFFTNCVKDVHHLDSSIIDGKYDSEFPNKPVSEEFEKIFRCVKLVNSICTYKSYDFDKNSLITKQTLSNSLIEEKSIAKRYFNKPATGTATVVYFFDKRIGLLTCAHIIDFPDTIIHHFKDKEGEETEYLRNISIKVRQSINVLTLPEIKNFKIIALDKKMDIAIIGRKFSMRPVFPVPVLRVPIGSAKELNWGNVVYLFGYPRGIKMITNCLVSNPNRDQHNSFIINAVAARGISGGLIMAIRDGVPNFELVGMAKAIAAESHYYLSPYEEYNISGYDISRPYREEIYVDTSEIIYYGILYAISIESISKFIQDNESILFKHGYTLAQFFR